MNAIMAAGLMALSMQSPAASTAAPASEPRIAGRLLKDTPDDVLKAALSGGEASHELRSDIRKEMDLRLAFRRGALTEPYRFDGFR